MYQEIKTLPEIEEKIKKLTYEMMSFQNLLSGASNREFENIERNIEWYEEKIKEAEARKEEVLKEINN